MKHKALPLLLLALALGAPALPAAGESAAAPAAAHTKAKARTGRAFIEMGVELAIATVNYWRKYTKFIEDWQFGLNWRDQKRKFFTSEGLRLDSNNLRLNWTHAWAGAVYYNWARSNRLGPAAALLFSTGGSLFWEYLAEWREISSINDHVYTALGGPAIGEPLFQIASHFRNRRGLGGRIGCLLVDPPLAINDLLDGRGRPPRLAGDDRSDFRFAVGGKLGPGAPSDDARHHANFDLDLRLVTLPGYGDPGSGSGFSRRPIANEYRIGFSFNERLAGEFAVATRCVLGGWWWKDVRSGAAGALRGSETWLGALTAWELFQKKPVVPYDGDDLGMTDPWFVRESPTRYADKHTTLHLFGPAFGWTGYAGKLSARADIEATLDFGMVNSLAYNDYTAGHDAWGVKTTLHNWGYYYALGYTLGGRVDLRRGPLRAEAGLRYQRFHSIQGHDRFQEDLRDDSPLDDSRLSWSAALAAAVPRTPLFLSLNLEGINRWGRFHEVAKTTRELRLFYRLGVTF